MEETIKERNKRNLIIYGALLLIILLWVISWLVIDFIIFPEGKDVFANRGAFGDKFGFINSLFSGLALTGIIISIFFQQKELSLQRKELKDTRKEFKEQNFQTTFFNLLKTQRQIADDFSAHLKYLKYYNQDDSLTIQGRQFFNQSKTELQRIIDSFSLESYGKYKPINREEELEMEPVSDWEAEDMFKSRKKQYIISYYKIEESKWNQAQNSSELQKAKLAYSIFFNKHNFIIGHYFRHLFHILNFLEKNKIEKIKEEDSKNEYEVVLEFQQYADFLQAQLSIPELFLLFYNALSFPKLQKLLISYNILENLPEEDLLSKEHNCIDGINLKSKNDIFI